MNQEYKVIIEKVKAEKDAVKRTFSKMKKKKPKEIDQLFHSKHEAFFQKNSCLDCANCCKTTSPIFRDVDIKRIAKQLKTKEAQFIDQYLRMDEESDYVLKSSPCSFLNEDNTCSIYEFRPLACAEYPHTNRKNMNQILDLTLKNTEICPAVATIVTKLILED